MWTPQVVGSSGTDSNSGRSGRQPSLSVFYRLWLDLQSSAVFSNLPSGIYGLGVIDADGCRSIPFGSVVSSAQTLFLK